jgi:hypothetical protein
MVHPRPPDPVLSVPLFWPAHATVRTTPNEAEAAFGQPGTMTARLIDQRDQLRQLLTDAVAQLDAIEAG